MYMELDAEKHSYRNPWSSWIDISPRPTDTRTLIPFLKDMEKHLGFKYSEIVADAGYESEENYLFIEGNGQTAYIKPQNYEISKTRKYKKDISKCIKGNNCKTPMEEREVIFFHERWHRFRWLKTKQFESRRAERDVWE